MVKSEINPASRRLIVTLATWGGAGYLPVAPGTWGSLVALPLWWGLSQAGPLGYGLGVAAVLALALWVAGPAQEILGRPDHGAIVIDEVAGQLITLAGMALTWQNALAGFLVFRLLDIFKPWPIRWLSRGPSGSLEVVIDDVMAGVMARLVLEVFLSTDDADFHRLIFYLC
ncbi:MAG: phosphatidylglycerophosphatase A [Deltaproteobacteria bacterium]|nr:phosphatidylglycerophosphatase A [Deltaproteobacteria bacterium]